MGFEEALNYMKEGKKVYINGDDYAIIDDEIRVFPNKWDDDFPASLDSDLILSDNWSLCGDVAED